MVMTSDHQLRNPHEEVVGGSRGCSIPSLSFEPDVDVTKLSAGSTYEAGRSPAEVRADPRSQ